MRATPGSAWARPALMSMTAAESATDSPAWRSSRATQRDSVAAGVWGIRSRRRGTTGYDRGVLVTDRRGVDAVLRAFLPVAAVSLLARINAYLVRWIRNKYRRYDSTRQAHRKLGEITLGYPRMFRHWRWVSTAW